jgi:hypothetical protein
MDVTRHQMIAPDATADETLFVCTDDACGRRVVVNRRTGQLTVIDQGDFWALHSGNTLGVPISMGIGVVPVAGQTDQTRMT